MMEEEQHSCKGPMLRMRSSTVIIVILTVQNRSTIVS